jgi:hypothetical protein
MFYPAGEIDKSLPTHDLLVGEFERFNDLQRHYATKPYPEEGVFEETTSASAVHTALRSLGDLAILNQLAISEGSKLEIPTSPMVEHMVPVFYRRSSSESSPYRSQPVVVAARMKKQPEDDRHPMAGDFEEDFDELVMAGIGVKIIYDRYQVSAGIGYTYWQRMESEELAEYHVSLTSTRSGNIGRLVAAKTIHLNKYSRLTTVNSKSISDIPKESVHKFMQTFREAAWESVSEPA